MKGYTQLAQEERYQIQAPMKAGHDQTEIINDIGGAQIAHQPRNLSQLWIARLPTYQAQFLADEHRQTRAQPRICSSTWSNVEKLPRENWSPEQISM